MMYNLKQMGYTISEAQQFPSTNYACAIIKKKVMAVPDQFFFSNVVANSKLPWNGSAGLCTCLSTTPPTVGLIKDWSARVQKKRTGPQSG